MQSITYIIIDKVAFISVVQMDELPGWLHFTHDPSAHVLRTWVMMCVCTLPMSKRKKDRQSDTFINKHIVCHKFLVELKMLWILLQLIWIDSAGYWIRSVEKRDTFQLPLMLQPFTIICVSVGVCVKTMTLPLVIQPASWGRGRNITCEDQVRDN